MVSDLIWVIGTAVVLMLVFLSMSDRRHAWYARRMFVLPAIASIVGVMGVLAYQASQGTGA